jgi:hypothetical protein
VTAPAPKFRFTYAVPVRHSLVRGNTVARNEQAVRNELAMRYGSEAAEQARVELASVEEPCNESRRLFEGYGA